MQTNCIFVPSNFVNCPLIFDILGVQDSEFFSILIANKIFCVTVLFYLFTFAINLWQWKFATADITAVFVNDQRGIQRRGQDFDKNFICNQYVERLAILNTEDIKSCR